jgi:CBS domain containing-hemolysin-like protein
MLTCILFDVLLFTTCTVLLSLITRAVIGRFYEKLDDHDYISPATTEIATIEKMSNQNGHIELINLDEFIKGLNN